MVTLLQCLDDYMILTVKMIKNILETEPWNIKQT
jgi:hypothetical protein